MELRPYTEADLIGRLSGIRVPAVITDSLAAGQMPSRPGEIARVAWDNSVFLLLVSSISETTVTGWFTDLAGNGTVPDLTEQDVSLGSAFLVEGPPTELPAISIDATVGELRSTPDRSVAEKLATFHTDSKMTSQWSPSQEVSDVVEAFDRLRGGNGEMPALLAAHGFTLARLKEVLGVESRTAFALLRGDDAPTPEQEEILARVAGIDITELAAAGPRLPDDLIDVLWENRFRAPTLSAASAEGEESTGWNSLARGTLALAPRSAATAPVSWRDRVERYIETAGL
jgi:transcriptional regulator with XRE-family HTH domain